MECDSKLRLLYIEQMLNNTDEQHPLTIQEISDYLEINYGISSHRTTIPADIALLQKAGMEIEIIASRPKKFYLNDYARPFSSSELRLLLDTVSSSKFITKQKSEELIQKLLSLSGPSDLSRLKRNLFTEGRLKQENEKIYYIIEAVNDAINLNKKISFLYFQYNVKKEPKLRNNGQPYLFSPYGLVWSGDYYYMVGYCDQHGNISTFRIDRVFSQPTILEDDAIPTPESFSLDAFTNGMIRMFNSEREDVELICDNSVMDSIIDKFGVDVATYAYDMKSFKMRVNVAVNHIFYSWVFGFGGKVRIKSPENVRKHYLEMLNSAEQNS